MSLTPAQIESLALQAVTRYPHIAREVGLEAVDFADETRAAFFRSLEQERSFLANGGAAPIIVAARAGIDRAWVVTEFGLPMTNPSQAREFARQLREHSIGEAFRAEAKNLAAKYSGLELVREMQRASQLAALRGASGDDVVSLRDAAIRFGEERLRQIDEGVGMGASTGLATVDKATKGFRGGEMTVLVGPGSAGKSTLALFFALHVARAGGHVVIFSGEMTHQQNGERVVYSEGAVSLSDDFNDVEQLCKALDRIRDCAALGRIFVDHRSSFPPARTRSVAESTKAKHGDCTLAIFDHLRHVQADRSDADYLRLAASAQAAKDFATDTGCHALVLAHMNGEAAKEQAHQQDGGKPHQAMLRGGPLIRDVADNMLALWCPKGLSSLHFWKCRQTGKSWEGRELALTYDLLTQQYGEVTRQ